MFGVEFRNRRLTFASAIAAVIALTVTKAALQEELHARGLLTVITDVALGAAAAIGGVAILVERLQRSQLRKRTAFIATHAVERAAHDVAMLVALSVPSTDPATTKKLHADVGVAFAIPVTSERERAAELLGAQYAQLALATFDDGVQAQALNAAWGDIRDELSNRATSLWNACVEIHNTYDLRTPDELLLPAMLLQERVDDICNPLFLARADDRLAGLFLSTSASALVESAFAVLQALSKLASQPASSLPEGYLADLGRRQARRAEDNRDLHDRQQADEGGSDLRRG